MKTKHTLFAMAAVLATGSAFAQINPSRIAISSGASAFKDMFARTLESMCTGNGGTMTSFNNFISHTTYVCADAAVGAGAAYSNKYDLQFINFGTSSFAEVRLAVQNGSFSAVCLINSWPAGSCPAADIYVNPGSSDGTRLDPAPSGSIPIGGMLDVEPSAWPTTVLASAGPTPYGLSLGVAQAFGLAVSSSLYTKLFNAQLSSTNATVSKPIPAGCTVTDTAKLECIPTVSKAQMATIMAGDEFNAAGEKGVGFLTGDSAQDGQTLIYVRYGDTSGTQAAAQAYFLGLPCIKSPLPIVPGGFAFGQLDFTYGALQVRTRDRSTSLRTQLLLGGDVIGVMSGENNQAESWRWVRIGGAALGENAAPAQAYNITNRATMLNGQYDFWFEATYVSSSLPGAGNFWSALMSQEEWLGARQTAGLANYRELTSKGFFKKDGLTCQMAVAN